MPIRNRVAVVTSVFNDETNMMASGCHAYTWAPAETDGISIRTETKSNGRFWPKAALRIRPLWNLMQPLEDQTDFGTWE